MTMATLTRRTGAAAAVLAMLAAVLVTSIQPASASLADPNTDADYGLEPTPASITLQPWQVRHVMVTNKAYWERKFAEFGVPTSMHTREVFDADGQKIGYWRAVFNEPLVVIDLERGSVRKMKWVYQPYDAWCTGEWQKVAHDPLRGKTLGCLPDEDFLKAKYGQEWFDGLWQADNANGCNKGGYYAKPRPNQDLPGGCYPAVDSIYAPSPHSSVFCAPWEPQGYDRQGIEECRYVNYDWMPTNYRSVPSDGITVSSTQNVTSTKTASVTVTESVTRSVKRSVVKASASRVWNGKRFTASASAPVMVSATAAKAATGSATRSATRSETASCTKPTRAQAKSCAETQAKSAAQAAADAAALADAQAAARPVAESLSAKASGRAAAKAAASVAVPKKAVGKARALAKKQALAKVMAQIAAAKKAGR